MTDDHDPGSRPHVEQDESARTERAELLEAQDRRSARGALKGVIDLSGDWDSAETNEAIARDFGLQKL